MICQQRELPAWRASSVPNSNLSRNGHDPLSHYHLVSEVIYKRLSHHETSPRTSASLHHLSTPFLFWLLLVLLSLESCQRAYFSLSIYTEPCLIRAVSRNPWLSMWMVSSSQRPSLQIGECINWSESPHFPAARPFFCSNLTYQNQVLMATEFDGSEFSPS